MKTLKFCGVPLSTEVGKEIFGLNIPHGYDVTVKYAAVPFGVHTGTLHNVTEVHHLYETPIGKRIAFESDIHMTGCTYDVKELDEVIIEPAQEKHKEF